MLLSRLIPCALDETECTIVFRDICGHLNHLSPSDDRKVAQASSFGVRSERWVWLPEWVIAVEIFKTEDSIKLNLEVENHICTDDCQPLAEILVKQLTNYFSHPTKRFQRRVFHVGWAKTGTSSLTKAMRILGYFSWQFAPWMAGFNHFKTPLPELHYDFSSVTDYTFLSDLPFCMLYKQLDEIFPGSLFVLTTRDIDTWLSSALSEANSHSTQSGHMHTIEQWAYGTDTADHEIFITRYLQHNKEVIEYFSGRSDFISIDLTRGNPWTELCDFLQLPIPDTPFPHLNKRA